jgi:molecular chaperone DnaJ
VKKAYRALAFQHHPDRNSGNQEAEEKFKTISAAYQAITNPDMQAPQAQSGEAGPSFINDLFNSDIFRNIFGEEGFSGFGRGAGRPENYNISITLPFKEACLGGVKHVEFLAPESCGDCGGSGGTPESKVTCTDCKGTGVMSRGNRGNLNIVFNTTCTKCAGRGHSFSTSCAKCAGKGRMQVPKKYDVRIPAGIQNGTTLRLAGMGGRAGARSKAGDLFIAVHVEQHPSMQQEGLNILSTANISLKSALLGCDINVETLYGEVTMKVPPCTRPGQKFALKDKGIKGASATGSHIVMMNIEFPESLTQEQQEQLDKIL